MKSLPKPLVYLLVLVFFVVLVQFSFLWYQKQTKAGPALERKSGAVFLEKNGKKEGTLFGEVLNIEGHFLTLSADDDEVEVEILSGAYFYRELGEETPVFIGGNRFSEIEVGAKLTLFRVKKEEGRLVAGGVIFSDEPVFFYDMSLFKDQ